MSNDNLTTEEECPDCSGFDRCDFHEGVRRGRKQIKEGDYTTLEEAKECCENCGAELTAADRCEGHCLECGRWFENETGENSTKQDSNNNSTTGQQDSQQYRPDEDTAEKSLEVAGFEFEWLTIDEEDIRKDTWERKLHKNLPPEDSVFDYRNVQPVVRLSDIQEVLQNRIDELKYKGAGETNETNIVARRGELKRLKDQLREITQNGGADGF